MKEMLKTGRAAVIAIIFILFCILSVAHFHFWPQTIQLHFGDRNITVQKTKMEKWWRKFEKNEWEPATLNLLQNLITEKTTVVDIGAWIGPITLYSAFLGASKVHALEPDPWAYQELSTNINLNPNLRPRITVYQDCIYGGSNASSPKILWLGRGNSGSSISRKISEENIIVTCYNWSEWLALRNIFQIDLVKIDVEGAEEDIISSGAFSLNSISYSSNRSDIDNLTNISNAGPYLLIALHPPLWVNKNFLPIDALKKSGYNCLFLSDLSIVDDEKMGGCEWCNIICHLR